MEFVTRGASIPEMQKEVIQGEMKTLASTRKKETS